MLVVAGDLNVVRANSIGEGAPCKPSLRTLSVCSHCLLTKVLAEGAEAPHAGSARSREFDALLEPLLA